MEHLKNGWSEFSYIYMNKHILVQGCSYLGVTDEVALLRHVWANQANLVSSGTGGAQHLHQRGIHRNMSNNNSEHVFLRLSVFNGHQCKMVTPSDH